MRELGNIVEDATIDFTWDTTGADGASITRATNGTVSVYKANGTTQSTAGVTDTEDFDSVTGVHHCRIDTSADAFYAVGNDYSVVLSGATIDGKAVNATLARFSIENRFNEVDVVKWLGGAVATPTVTGVPEVDVTHFGGSAGTFASGIPAVNATQLSGDATAADNAEAFFDGTGYAGGTIKLGVNTVQIEGGDATDALAAASGGLDAAGVRAAVGLASANLDTQLGAIDDYLDTELAAVKTVTDQFTAAQAELAAVPAANATPLQKLNWLFLLHRNKRTQNSGTETVYADDGSTVVATSTKTDSAGLFSRGEYTT
jgi:hypothetical protein